MEQLEQKMYERELVLNEKGLEQKVQIQPADEPEKLEVTEQDKKKFEGEPIGRNMPAALKGDLNDLGGIAPGYKGNCKNAIPGYTGPDAIRPQDFAQNKMQEGRKKNKE